MNIDSDRAALAYAQLDLWITQQLEVLVNRWIAWAAPCDARQSFDEPADRRAAWAKSDRSPRQERD